MKLLICILAFVIAAYGQDTCCCFGKNAGESDRCLPGVSRDICLGPSVEGTCQVESTNTCCCRPAGEVNDLNCIPRIPQPLCEKATGAECVVEATTPALCNCRLPPAPGSAPGTPDRIQRLTESICNKFQGECEVAPDTCCCIVNPTFNAAGQEIFPSPNDPGVPDRGECIVVTKDECLGTGGRKRDGVCHNPVVEEVEPRCLCQDPAVIGEIKPLDEPILVHVCEEKLGSICIPAKCCCKYPSAPNEPCLAGVLQTTCTAVGGAQCIAVNEVVTCPMLDVSVESSSTQNLENIQAPYFDVSTFIQEPLGTETVYTALLGESIDVSVAPASPDLYLYAINWLGSSLQIINPSTYTIDVFPTNAVPGILSGFVGGDGLVATITPDMIPGRYRITFSNTRPVNGILAFSNPVSSVKITFPALLPGAPTSSFSLSGIIVSTRANAEFAPLVLAPGLLNPSPSITSDSESVIADEEACGNFDTAPGGLQFYDDAALEYTIDFLSDSDEDSVCIYFQGLTTDINFAHDDSTSPAPAIVAGNDDDSGEFQDATPYTLSVGGSFNGVVQIFGSPSEITLTLAATSAGTKYAISRCTTIRPSDAENVDQ